MSKILERLLAFHSSPAICGIKASNLICCSLSKIFNLLEEIDEVNKNYNPTIYIKILQIKNDRVLILVYRRSILESCLRDHEKLSFLNSIGYPFTDNIDCLLDYLRYRLNTSTSFPHEIGIFLGYELSDVLGFINNKECLYSGPWKIYSNIESKIKLFDKYEKCRTRVLHYIDNGYNINVFMK